MALEVNYSPREPTVRSTLLTCLITAALLVTSSPAISAQQQPPREVTQIKGDLYRFRNAGHFSVFLVTPAGIIATDPIDADAARWLKQLVKMEKYSGWGNYKQYLPLNIEGMVRHIQTHRGGN